jgi:hypothetical protein
MGYASQSGRARTSLKRPQAHAICDRCGARYNHADLKWQMEWRGATLQNIRVLVCDHCYDTPQENVRSIVLPADPTPIINARVQDFDLAENDYRSLSRPTVLHPIVGIPIPDNTLRVTEDCQNRTVRPFGIPSGMSQPAVMPFNAANHAHLGVPLQVLSVTANGTATVQVTCSAPHNLVPLPVNTVEGSTLMDPQVSIEGLANTAACGFYSVTLLGATAFTYMTYGNIPAGALLTPGTRIITALVSLPRGYIRIPKLFGPSAFTGLPTQVCFLETEDGTGMFLLEDGSGVIQLESCMQPPTASFFFELENSLGQILLENGVDFLEQEFGP